MKLEKVKEEGKLEDNKKGRSIRIRIETQDAWSRLQRVNCIKKEDPLE